MDKNKIKVALLGLGRIGQMHAKNLIENREFKLKYVFDLNKDLLKKISNKYNVTSINKPDLAFSPGFFGFSKKYLTGAYIIVKITNNITAIVGFGVLVLLIIDNMYNIF